MGYKYIYITGYIETELTDQPNPALITKYTPPHHLPIPTILIIYDSFCPEINFLDSAF